MTGPVEPPGGDGLVVNDAVVIPRSELTVRATKSGGPGGQHVNTSSSRIEIVWNVRESAALDEEQRARVRERISSRIDGAGAVRVVSSQSRSQLQNRRLAEERLAELIRHALTVPKKRKKTKPSRAAREARLQEKKRRSERKRDRRGRDDW